MSRVTEILSAAGTGQGQPSDELLQLLYDELRQLAAQKMKQERPGQTLDATGLVHEAYLRLVGSEAQVQWNGRGHSFAAAAEAMRRIETAGTAGARRPQRAVRGRHQHDNPGFVRVVVLIARRAAESGESVYGS